MPSIRYPAGSAAPAPHHATHEPGGADEVHGVAPAPHAIDHELGGSDVISPVLMGAVAAAEKGVALGVATLDASGYVPTAQLPPITITRVYVVASEIAQLALTTDEGDAVVRTDIGKTYFALNDTPPPKTMTDYQEVLSPAGAVVSVCGKIGIVTLEASDITYAAESGKVAVLATAMVPVVESAKWTQYSSLWNTTGGGSAEAHGIRMTASGASSTDPTGHWIMEWTTNGGVAWNQLFKADETEGFTFGAAGLGTLYSKTVTPFTTANSLSLKGYDADGATAVGVKIGNRNALGTAGAKILSLYNDNMTTEKSYFDLEGGYNCNASSLGTTPASRINLTNPTAAAAGAQQYSPSLVLGGNGWKTDSGGASQACEIRMYCVPAQGVTAPTSLFILQRRVGGSGAWTQSMGVDGSGNVYAGSGGQGFYGSSINAPPNNSVSLKGQKNNGSAAVGAIVDNINAFTIADTKLLSIRNATVEQAYVGPTGSLGLGSSEQLKLYPKEIVPAALIIASIGAAGSVDIGDHTYKVTLVTAQGETEAGTVSATATTTGGNQTVNLSAIPIGSPNCTSRRIYRNSVAIPGTWRLLTTIANNTATTYSDTATDASISGAVQIPIINTTSNVIYGSAGGLVLGTAASLETPRDIILQPRGVDAYAVNAGETQTTDLATVYSAFILNIGNNENHVVGGVMLGVLSDGSIQGSCMTKFKVRRDGAAAPVAVGVISRTDVDKEDPAWGDGSGYIVQVDVAHTLGDGTTQWDVTNPSGTTFRYTYDGTGTDPRLAQYLRGQSQIIITGTNLAAGNNGTFIITAIGGGTSGAGQYFEVTNASGVVESDKAIGAGSMTCCTAAVQPLGKAATTIDWKFTVLYDVKKTASA